MTSHRRAFIHGARDSVPVLLGNVPFGMVTGATAVDAGFSPLQAQAMSTVIFSGTAQLVANEFVAQNSPLVLVLFAVLVINARMVMYSASISPFFRRLSKTRRRVYAYLLTDPAYALSISKLRETNLSYAHWYYFGVSAAIWANWQLATLTGILFGPQIPSSLQLEFAVPLIFIALLIPLLKNRATITAALLAGVVTILASVLPFNVGVLIGASVGIVAGIVVERGTT